MKKTLLFLLAFCCHFQGYTWGFFAHERINRMAVFMLPPEMLPFFKYHIRTITERATHADRRRYAVENEAACHYIDLDVYGDSALLHLPKYWNKAVEKYSEDSLRAYGIVPWHINRVRYQLTEAFREKNVQRILALSADLGHYIADANVPLHTTQNYNGQLSNQHGIHGFWESRLPELFADRYYFFMPRAAYLSDPQARAWQAVAEAHAALDSVLRFERELTLQTGEDKKFSTEARNGMTTRVYSREFSTAYHDRLAGQVERRMRASIQMTGDFWYTCWIEAGQPDLNALIKPLSKADRKALETKKEAALLPFLKLRGHED